MTNNCGCKSGIHLANTTAPEIPFPELVTTFNKLLTMLNWGTLPKSVTPATLMISINAVIASHDVEDENSTLPGSANMSNTSPEQMHADLLRRLDVLQGRPTEEECIQLANELFTGHAEPEHKEGDLTEEEIAEMVKELRS